MADDQNPTIMNHVSVGTDDLKLAGDFYDNIMSTLGAKRLFEEDFAIAYGKQWPEFWVQLPFNQKKPTPGNGVHIAFMAPDREAVDAFYVAAIDGGGTCGGKPGEREYAPEYYAAFVFDMVGNKLEAVHMPL
ncbi:MAG: VOC family protein [Oceanicoccus sp.]